MVARASSRIPLCLATLSLVIGARAQTPAITCTETFLDPATGYPTTIQVALSQPTAGTVLRGWEPDCGEYEVRGIASAHGIPAIFDFYVVIDVSGSTGNSSGMDVNGDGYMDSILAAEVASVRAFISSIDLTYHRVAIISFDHVAHVECPLTSSQSAMNAALGTLSPGSGTNYGAGMEIALAEHARAHDPGHEQSILFLSDGFPTDEHPFPPAHGTCVGANQECTGILWAEEAAARGVVVNTFGVGSAAAPTILAEMAHRGDGQFFQVDVAGEIIDVLPRVIHVGIASIVVTNTNTGQTVSIPPSPDGHFVTPIDLVEGRNDLVVTAISDHDSTWRVICPTDVELSCIVTTCPPAVSIDCAGLGGTQVDGLVATASRPEVQVRASSAHDGTGPGDADASGVYPAGDTLVTFLFYDDLAGRHECTTLVHVNDAGAPTIGTVPAEIFAACAPPPPEDPTVSDDCDPAPVLHYSEHVVATTCARSYDVLREWHGVDHSGNATTVTQVVHVRDDEAPVFSGVPADVVVQCDAVPAAVPVDATDACLGAVSRSFAEERIDGACPDAYTLVRTWTARDACGNESAASQRIDVQDTVAPVILDPTPDTTGTCGDVPAPPVVRALDACGPVVPSFREERVDGACAGSYTLVRTWTAIDRCGNTAERQQHVSVSDVSAPVLAGLPGDVATTCAAIPPAPDVTAADDCDGTVSVVLAESRVDGPCPGTYSLVRTWTATDACGNASSQSRRVEVSDVTAPVLSALPGDVVTSCDAIPVPPAIIATDECGETPVVAFAEARIDGACPHSYSLVRTWSATDACGNAASGSQRIEVQDLVAPELSGVPADAVAACDAIPPPAAVGAFDACEGALAPSLTESHENEACSDTYTLVRTWSVSDACGNASEATQRIRVSDVQAPTLAGVPPDVTIPCTQPLPPPASVSGVDLCDPAPRVVLDERREDGGCPGRYRVVRTWTATDRCGNAASRGQVIDVVDDTAPVITPDPRDARCLWPPRHDMTVLRASDFHPGVEDDCSGPVRWSFTSCASSQADDGPGDGSTTGDCVIAPDGQSIAVRTERSGHGGHDHLGREYVVSIVAADACGNASASTPIATIRVPHDQSNGSRCR